MSEPDRHAAYRNGYFSSELYSRQQEFNTPVVLQAYAASSYDQRLLSRAPITKLLPES